MYDTVCKAASPDRQNPEHTPGTVDGHYSITPVLLIGTSFDYTKAPDAKYEQIDLG
ncbi:hypothetical protein [Caballeronia sp. LjRoot31]|uniref:hypothetical protein n=1 Tax=Caballeronia sp. LjRoot31 TaxID=3342324 RepID=UPI003F502316